MPKLIRNKIKDMELLSGPYTLPEEMESFSRALYQLNHTVKFLIWHDKDGVWIYRTTKGYLFTCRHDL